MRFKFDEEEYQKLQTKYDALKEEFKNEVERLNKYIEEYKKEFGTLTIDFEKTEKEAGEAKEKKSKRGQAAAKTVEAVDHEAQTDAIPEPEVKIEDTFLKSLSDEDYCKVMEIIIDLPPRESM